MYVNTSVSRETGTLFSLLEMDEEYRHIGWRDATDARSLTNRAGLHFAQLFARLVRQGSQ